MKKIHHAGPAGRPIPRLAVLAIAFMLTAAEAVIAQPSLESGTVIEAAERLRPGEFLWAPQVAPDGPVLLVVSVATQRAVVYRNGLPIGITTVSTGRPGYSTPTGVFTILQKRVEHYSSLYNNAPMPYMQRLTWQGVALHAGQLPGYPASHGCIRLPLEFARLLYGVTRVGMTVVITDSAALPAAAPAPTLLRSRPHGVPDSARERPVWQPERSPAGPVSILISGSDRRVLVVRNGRVIGSAPIQVDRPIERTEAYVLRAVDGAGSHWLRLPLPGQDASQPLDRADAQRFQVEESFRQAVRAVLRPGTTVLVTADPLRSESGSDELTLLESEAEGTDDQP